jgi:hypothetical protein
MNTGADAVGQLGHAELAAYTALIFESHPAKARKARDRTMRLANKALAPRAFKVFSHLLMGDNFKLKFGDTRDSGHKIAKACAISDRQVWRLLNDLEAAKAIVRHSERVANSRLREKSSFAFPILLAHFVELEPDVLPERVAWAVNESLKAMSELAKRRDGSTDKIDHVSTGWDGRENLPCFFIIKP